MSLFWIFATAFLLAAFVFVFLPLNRVKEKGAQRTMLAIVLIVPLAAISLYGVFSNYDPVGAHVHERAVKVFCLLNGIEGLLLPDLLIHHQERSHQIIPNTREKAERLAAQEERFRKGRSST